MNKYISLLNIRSPPQTGIPVWRGLLKILYFIFTGTSTWQNHKKYYPLLLIQLFQM